MSVNQAYPIEGKITKNFGLWEFCNSEAKETTKLVVTPEFIAHVQRLQCIRDLLGKSLNVSSGYRTSSYNKSCGGDKNSAHLNGLATDITGINQNEYEKCRYYWEALCKKDGAVGGVNFYNWGIHFCSNEDRFGHTTFQVRDYR